MTTIGVSAARLQSVERVEPHRLRLIEIQNDYVGQSAQQTNARNRQRFRTIQEERSRQLAFEQDLDHADMNVAVFHQEQMHFSPPK